MTTIQNRRIGHSAPNARSTISTDLNLAGFHFWSHLKNSVNVMTVKDVEEIQNRVTDGGKSTCNTHRIFEHAQSLKTCNTCRVVAQGPPPVHIFCNPLSKW